MFTTLSISREYLTRYFFAAALLLGVALLPSAASADSTITDLVVASDDLEALEAAVVSQDLAATLAGDGPFTVFAPDDDAFAALPSYVGSILADQPELLTDILLYHVVAGDLQSGEVLASRTLHTLQGERVRVNQTGAGAFINSSELIALDITASNGTVHVIDRVLIPQSVYKAVLVDIRSQLQQLRALFKEVNQDRVSERTAH